VEHVVRFAATAGFIRAFKKLNKKERAQAVKAIKAPIGDTSNPELKFRKLQGVADFWEVNIGENLKMTFQIQGRTVLLRHIGRYSEPAKNLRG
jgi:mRNA-degrading endonuclease RelE of RelBE toxin-antitoxin system